VKADEASEAQAAEKKEEEVANLSPLDKLKKSFHNS
jgi:hypothetical protein